MNYYPSLREGFMIALAESLEIPQSRYDSADRSYRAVAEWLDRDASRFARVTVRVYSQGSFRLGTAIRPLSGDENYDLDVVCEVDVPKLSITQAQLHDALGAEIVAYAKAHGMQEPKRSNRCWTLHYADEAQFHMDLLPSVPDGARVSRLIKSAGMPDSQLYLTSLGITDSEHYNYHRIHDDWPISNPDGYAAWFASRMKVAVEKMRKSRQIEARVKITDIPEYREKTPLQFAIQILKRHRDLTFSERTEVRPSSIILTTLAAHAYDQELSIAEAVENILTRMSGFIESRAQIPWIPNPSDPRENFADCWQQRPELGTALQEWIETAQVDFRAALSASTVEGFQSALAPRLGRKLIEGLAEPLAKSLGGLAKTSVLAPKRLAPKLLAILDAPHRKPVPWQAAPAGTHGTVWIKAATYQRDGFRPTAIVSDQVALEKRATLIFEADTDVRPPYRVYWQVVNIGDEARHARNLRGGYDEGASVVRGHLSRRETTLFRGSHSIECFIVQGHQCVARTGPFIVNIK